MSSTRSCNEPSLVKPYVGKWTQEEEEYSECLIENFRAGNLSGVKDGATLRHYLAEMLNCRVKRISKRYENTGYNGRAQYKDKEANLSPEESMNMTRKLEDQRQAFLASRNQVMQGFAYTRGSKKSRTRGTFKQSRAEVATPPAVATANPVQNNADMSLASCLATLSLAHESTIVRSQEPVRATFPAPIQVNDMNVLLQAALIKNLANPVPTPTLAPAPLVGAASVSGLAEALRMRHQMEAKRTALLEIERALQNYQLASALGMATSIGPPKAA